MYYDLIDPSTGKPFTSSDALWKWWDEHATGEVYSGAEMMEKFKARKAQRELEKRADGNSETT